MFLNGIELANVEASLAVQGGTAYRASLIVGEEDENTRAAWIGILRLSRANPARMIRASIGPAGGPAFPTVAEITLRVLPSYWVLIAIGLGLVVGVLIVLGKTTKLLRNSNGAATLASYSLAKHQMAVWFVVVLASYLYIWMITGVSSLDSPTALALIGISGATGLVATGVDKNKRSQEQAARAAQELERNQLELELNDADTGLQAQLTSAVLGSPEAVQLTATVSAKLARLNVLIEALSQPLRRPDENKIWFLDLLTDESGVSFHRLQMMIWTLVLVAVFVRAVWVDLLMPEFDATLLGLMGISSGTYIGFKFPEQVS